MSIFHSTVSRREFMKALGLTGAGLGATAALVPSFHDLDEVMSAPTATRNRPWYVKERAHLDTTTEVDWDLLKRWDNRNNAQSTYAASHYPSYASAAERSASGSARRKEREQGQLDGYDHKWRALSAAKSDGSEVPAYGFATFTDPTKQGSSNEALGLPKWTGSPEEASRLMMAAIRFSGASMVGFDEIDTKYQTKLARVCTSSGNAAVYPAAPNPAIAQWYEFENTPDGKAYEKKDAGGTHMISPSNNSFLVQWGTSQTPELRGSNSIMANSNTPTNWKGHENIKARVSKFLNALGGYQLYGLTGDQSTVINTELGMVLTGGGENSRQQLYSNDLDLGPNHNNCSMMTNLPVAPTNPIDAGMWKFCASCGICADQCPSGSISKDKETTWEVPQIEGLPNVTKVPGIKAFWTNMIGCRNYTNQHDGCAPALVRPDDYGGGRSCFSVCPFGGDRTAMGHKLIRASMATTPVFNGFLASMAGVFGTGETALRADDWWDMGLPSFGFPTHIQATKGQWKM
jgi:epoxyqueuosine reductase